MKIHRKPSYKLPEIILLNLQTARFQTLKTFAVFSFLKCVFKVVYAAAYYTAYSVFFIREALPKPLVKTLTGTLLRSFLGAFGFYLVPALSTAPLMTSLKVFS